MEEKSKGRYEKCYGNLTENSGTWYDAIIE
jgi:hypothetical protein